jgi:hypothetical protein
VPIDIKEIIVSTGNHFHLLKLRARNFIFSNPHCPFSPRNRNNLDNNQQRLRSPATKVNENDVKGGNQDDNKYSNAMDRMDIYSDSNENAIKTGDEITEDDRPPRLPPRPPPRPRNTMSSETGMINSCQFFSSKCLPLLVN